MFENIIGQTHIISSLKREITDKTLPPAILFSGPQYAGKLSCALETARALTCEKETADWACGCRACTRHRFLMHPDILMMGYRDFTAEIAASAAVYQNNPRAAGMFLFVRAVRKFLKRFDPVLYGDDDTKMKQARSSLEQISGFIDSVSEQKEFTRRMPEKKCADIVSLCEKLSGEIRTENIPIDHVRRAISWAHISTPEKNKIIIIDNADRMLDSSRNSLLKLLEEPPAHVYIILVTTRKGAIIKTVLSRVRPYQFLQRTREETMEILRKIFRDDLLPDADNKNDSAAAKHAAATDAVGAATASSDSNKHDTLPDRTAADETVTLDDFFMSWKKVHPKTMRALARRFIEFILADKGHEPDILDEMAELFAGGDQKTVFTVFAHELTCRFSDILKNTGFDQIGFDQIEKWAGILRTIVRDMEVYNVSPKNSLESLYYKMRACL